MKDGLVCVLVMETLEERHVNSVASPYFVRMRSRLFIVYSVGRRNAELGKRRIKKDLWGKCRKKGDQVENDRSVLSHLLTEK